MERTRGFEAVVEEMRKGTMDYILPTRGTSRSCGYDLASPIDVVIEPHSSVLIWTNIKAFMQDDEVLEVYIRSSTAIKRDLILKNTVGIIDSDYYSMMVMMATLVFVYVTQHTLLERLRKAKGLHNVFSRNI